MFNTECNTLEGLNWLHSPVVATSAVLDVREKLYVIEIARFQPDGFVNVYMHLRYVANTTLPKPSILIYCGNLQQPLGPIEQKLLPLGCCLHSTRAPDRSPNRVRKRSYPKPSRSVAIALRSNL